MIYNTTVDPLVISIVVSTRTFFVRAVISIIEEFSVHIKPLLQFQSL
jgi:hypothetical protein